MDRFWHYTTSTGDGRWSPRGEVSDDVIAMLAGAIRPALATRRQDLLRAGQSRSVEELAGAVGSHDQIVVAADWWIGSPERTPAGSWSYLVGRGPLLLAECWLLVCQADAEAAWPVVRAAAEADGYLCSPTIPPLPCLAVVPTLESPADRDTWLAVGDFERCLAWALIVVGG